MSGTVRGVDVSSWQHPYGEAIDWEDVAKDGYTFMLVKATQGTGYQNPWLHRDIDDARAAGLLVGAYHFLEVNPEISQQADVFISSWWARCSSSACGATLSRGPPSRPWPNRP